MRQTILGISAYYHDSAAAVIVDGKLVAAAQEERFTRKKHDAGFPLHAIRYVLEESGVEPEQLSIVAFYEKPFIKFERLLETYHAFAPRGLSSFSRAIPLWIKDKLFMKSMLRRELKRIGIPATTTLLFPEHHLSHAASAFFPSPFEEAAILTIDGVGEWATTVIGHGRGNSITILDELHFPHSLGLLYSAFTYYCGFRVNSGEYKLMGLAPYGIPGSEQVERYTQIIRDFLVDIRHDGSLLLNMEYFDYATGMRMTNDRKWEKLFGIPRRTEETELTQPYMDLALAIQNITNEVVLKLAATAVQQTGCRKLVMAGGVALNCVANGKILEEKVCDDLWVQPAAGDAGGAVGAAFAAWYIYSGNARVYETPDSMQGAFLGPAFSNEQIERLLRRTEVKSRKIDNYEQLADEVAALIDSGKVIGWFQGRMEFGPRALGNRSILGDARNPEMQKKMNLKIKYRESFRPFAPSILEEYAHEYCEFATPSPYMLVVFPVKKERCNPIGPGTANADLFTRLYYLRSDVPAITHIDYSARVQTVSRETNYRYWKLIDSFRKRTGFGILINTSFNVRGEPIVCTPEDALRTFMNTEIDYLVLNDFLIDKQEVAHLKDRFSKGFRFEMD
jgi:carbamoyltransferase